MRGGELDIIYVTSAVLAMKDGKLKPEWLKLYQDFPDRFIIGDKASVKEEIARYCELLGVDHFIMRCQWPGLPQSRVLESIRRLGEIFASS